MRQSTFNSAAGDWPPSAASSLAAAWTPSPSAGRRRNPAGWSLCRSQGGLGLLSALSKQLNSIDCSSYSTVEPFGHCLGKRQDKGPTSKPRPKQHTSTCARTCAKCRAGREKLLVGPPSQPYGGSLACLVSSLCLSHMFGLRRV